MTNLTVKLVKRPRRLGSLVALALAGLFAISAAGCASKKPQQPKTINEFLSQPRPK